MKETVGKAVLRAGAWEISVEAHVMIRLKHVFPNINKAHVGTVYLSDTPANVRDLLWFAERYPLEIKPRAYAALQAARQWANESLVQKIIAGDYTPPDVKLALPVRDYQTRAAAIVLQTGGLLLADDLGLGKTVASFAAFARKECLPAVVVTQTHLPPQWQRELARFAPKLRSHIVTEGKPYDLTVGSYNRSTRAYTKVSMPDVLIMNYHKLPGWAEFLVENKLCKFLTLDECQELRHRDTAKYNAAVHLRSVAGWCLGLSATPIYNYGGEMWNVMNVIQPGCLGTREEYIREWCKTGGNDEKPMVKDPRALGSYLRRTGYMLRRTVAEVKMELPALQRVVHPIDIDDDRLDEVQKDVEELARILLATSGDPKRKMRAAADLDWKLRQATGLAKAVHVAHFVRMLVLSGEKVVLFGWHKAVYEIWEKAFSNPNADGGNLRPAFFTGSESASQKQDALRRFTDKTASDATPVLVMSLRSGAGIDGLQKVARVAVFGELDWSPNVHWQDEGRLHRFLQQHPVVAYYLVADSGSDPVISDVLNLKAMQSEGIRNPDAAKVEALAEVDPDHVKKLARNFLARRRGAGPGAPAASAGMH